MEASKKRELMLTAPMGGLIIRLAVPSMLTMLISSLYNIVDTFFVSMVSTSATAAVGILMSLMGIIQAVGFFFGQGAGINLSRELGRKEHELAAKLVSTGFFSCLIIGVVIGVTGLIFMNPLIWFFGATPTIFEYAKDYMFYILLAAPFMTSSFTLNNILRYQGSAFFGMLGMAGGAILNCILDPILIFYFHMGVAGAGLATCIGQIMSFFILLWGCSRSGNVPIKLKNFAPNRFIYKEIAKAGLPSLLRQGMMSFSGILLNQAANTYGDVMVAAISVSQRACFVINSIALGLGQGFQPVCGFNYGASNFDRVKKAFRFTLVTGTAFLTVSGIFCFVMADPIVGIFANDEMGPRLIELGSYCFRAQSVTFPLLGLNLVGTMYMQAIDLPLIASIQSFARQGVFLIPLIFIMSFVYGARGVQLCTPVAEAFTFALSVALLVIANKKLDKRIAAES